jgi:hypothetical protein
MSESAYSRLIAALEDHGCHVQGTMAQCPAHGDRVPSLSVTEVDGKVLVRCFAGCETTDILAALGLTWADLFDQPAHAQRQGDRPEVWRPAPSKLPAWVAARRAR